VDGKKRGRKGDSIGQKKIEMCALSTNPEPTPNHTL
jgi:hypothetical protein